MADEEETLETTLNKATNPANTEEDYLSINRFCELVQDHPDGPSIATRLLAHKIQSPQEKEALFAVTTTEECVRQCGKRVHVEIGKFRFLNEIIKVVSPKYLGNRTPERVKERCISALRLWTVALKDESKVLEAYNMLKKQGIVKDPEPQPAVGGAGAEEEEEAPPPRDGIELDQDKSQLLAKLLKSKNPEDLQAANRLIKGCVRQDVERQERVSRRMCELDTISNNIKLLREMLQQYNPSTSTTADQEIMKELYDTLEQKRPALFRLASDTDDKETDAISEILQTSDDVGEVMKLYKQRLENGHADSNNLLGLDVSGQKPQTGSAGLLEQQLSELGLESAPAAPTTLAAPHMTPSPQPTAPLVTPGTSSSASSDLQELFAPAPSVAQPPPYSSAAAAPSAASGVHSDLADLIGIGASSQPPAPPTSAASLLDSSAGAPSLPPGLLSASLSAPVDFMGSAQEEKQPSALDSLGLQALQQALPLGATPSAQVTQAKKVPMSLMAAAAASTPAAAPSFGGDVGLLGASPAPVVVEPLTNVTVPLETIEPGEHAPMTACERDGVRLVLHLGKARPRPDVLVCAVSTTSSAPHKVTGLLFQAAVPKSMKVKLQPASGSDLPAFNPILPPSAVTQVMLIANPAQERIRLKFKLSFKVGDKAVTELGDIDTFPVQ